MKFNCPFPKDNLLYKKVKFHDPDLPILFPETVFQVTVAGRCLVAFKSGLFKIVKRQRNIIFCF